MKNAFKKYRVSIAVLLCIALANVLTHVWVVRWDMTDDKLYSISDASKALLRQTDAPMEVTLLLDGELSEGFRQLRKSAEETLNEMSVYAQGMDIRYLNVNTADEETQRRLQQMGVKPYTQSQTEHNGKTVMINTFPYAIIRYKGDSTLVNLFERTIGTSEEENLSAGMAQLEFRFAEAIYRLQHKEAQRIAILSGHDEPEAYTYDLEDALSPYFFVYRGSINSTVVNVHILDSFRAIILASPQTALSDIERYIIDQYIMRGGAVLWAVDGVRSSTEMLQDDGFTPIIAHELGINDLLFRYGVRIDPQLIQDRQCLSVMVDVSADPAKPNLQPIPWTYAPLLMPNIASPITKDLQAPVSSQMISPIDMVGGNDGINKTVLLYTSNATKLTGTPNEVNLNDFDPDIQLFRYQSVPVAVSLEGSFPSAYAYRMVPEGVEMDEPTRKQSVPTRQVVIGGGSVVLNQWQGNQPLPMGYDRTSHTQFGNRDMVINAVLWLTGSEDLIPLRAKTTTLRMLNNQRAYENRTAIERISTICPIVILALIGGVIMIIRKSRYEKR